MSVVGNFFRRKRAGYYIGLVTALIGIATAIVYILLFTIISIDPANAGALEPYFSIPAFSLFIAGGAVYILLSFVHMDKMGAGIMAGLYFLGLILFAIPSIDLVASKSMDLANAESIAEMIMLFIETFIVAIMMIVSVLIAQVIAWIPFVRKKETTTEEEVAIETTEEATPVDVN